MEFLNGILVEVSGLKLDSSQAQVFVWFSSLILQFYIMLFMYRLVFLFCGFSVRVLKPEKSMVFFEIRQ